jgi:hypothetical protein
MPHKTLDMAEHKYHVFDLDDTLVRYGRRGRIAVPRQTFHALRALRHAGHECIVVSYNPTARVVTTLVGLNKYVALTVAATPDDMERADLVARARRSAGWPDGAGFNYYDDRADNVGNIRERFGSQVVAHIVRADTLWQNIGRPVRH